MKAIGAFIPRCAQRRYTPVCSDKEIRVAIAERNRQGLMDWRLRYTWHQNAMPVKYVRPHTACERRAFEVWLYRELERCKSFLDRLRYTRGPTDFMKGLK